MGLGGRVETHRAALEEYKLDEAEPTQQIVVTGAPSD